MKIKKQLIKREIAGDVILVPVGKTVLENNGLFILNEVSSDIWDLLNLNKSLDEIVAVLVESYDAPEEVIRRDTVEFLETLGKQGIIEY